MYECARLGSTVLHDLILISLLVFAVAVISGLALTGARALALWRTFRGFRRSLDEALELTSQRVAGTENRLAGAGMGSEPLDAARARLQDSLARMSALARAAAEVRGLVGRVRATLPSK